ncbi:cytochrome P450 [Streptomyces anandii]|uniref:cytochrome P450 n=1 Tax=Streptomyces anandii TaxID=285454 RepID=UPI00378C83BB
MDAHRRPPADHTLSLIAGGYAWLPQRIRQSPDRAVPLRIMGRPALALSGPEAVRFFYDEHNIRRHGAIPEPVTGTLFGHGAVHTLDGQAHRQRKELFLPLLEPDRIAGVVGHVTAAWDEAVPEWAARPQVVLFDEAAAVLTRGVCRWAGVPLQDAEARSVAADLVAMVDGFATLGPRHWRARRARARQEARTARVIEDLRSGRGPAAGRPDSLLARVAAHRDADGGRLPARTAAVELLNVVRPTVAVSWFAAFAAHALHRWPAHRERLRDGDPAYAAAFAHEVRRFYPFAPFLGGRAARDLTWRGHQVPAGGTVLLDVFGQNHDEELWADPYTFRPRRFLERPPQRDELIPQGGSDPRTGHRCPGEGVTVGLLESLAVRLARLDYEVPAQDLRISLRRIPARVRSGFAVTAVHEPGQWPAPAGARAGAGAGS